MHPYHQEPQGQEQVGGAGLPDLLPAHGRGSARGRRGLDPRALEGREPSPLGQRCGLRRGPPPAAHRQRPRNHGHLKESSHPPLPHHQIPIRTTHTSHQTTNPTNPLNRVCRPPVEDGVSFSCFYYTGKSEVGNTAIRFFLAHIASDDEHR